ncbi:MAG: DUF58 domain-containing protein [Nitrososphaerota archaeon]|nr:DUF58 domain-containing protein [Nitrososphaerota archaeon]
MPFERTPRGNVLILLSSVLIAFGLIFASSAAAFLYVGIGLLMYYYASRLILQMKTSVLNRLEVTRNVQERIDEGKELEVTLTMVNRTMLRLSLEIFDSYPPFLRLVDGSNSTLISVPSRGYTNLTYKLRLTSVGKQTFGTVHLILRDIAGLFFYERNVEVQTIVEVTPRIRELERGALATVSVSTYGGSLASTKKGEGTDFADIRQYTQGDPYKRVEWRATARTGRLMVRDFYAETQLNVMVLLDATDTMSYGRAGETKLDFAIRSIASLVAYLSKRGDFLGITVFHGSGPATVIPLARGSVQTSLIMRLLGNITPGLSTENALADGVKRAMALGKIKGRALIFVITDLDSKSDLSSLKQLVAMHHQVIVMSPFTPLFESHDIKGMDRMIYSIRTTHMYKERQVMLREAAALGVPVLDVGPDDLFSKLISKVEQLRKVGGS